jgi:hypothetical protein
MKAEILPLGGKYYGTKIKVRDGKYEYRFKLWNIASCEPSDRELEGICTIEQWRANERIVDEDCDDSWYPSGIPAQELCDVGDGHFESRETYAAAIKIVNAINENTE